VVDLDLFFQFCDLGFFFFWLFRDGCLASLTAVALVLIFRRVAGELHARVSGIVWVASSSLGLVHFWAYN